MLSDSLGFCSTRDWLGDTVALAGWVGLVGATGRLHLADPSTGTFSTSRPRVEFRHPLPCFARQESGWLFGVAEGPSLRRIPRTTGVPKLILVLLGTGSFSGPLRTLIGGAWLLTALALPCQLVSIV